MARRRSGREGRPPVPAGPMTAVVGLAAGLFALWLLLELFDR